AALRRRLSAELRVEPREIAVTVLGLPPAQLLAPQATATVAGLPVDKVSPLAFRRALTALHGRAAGPVALAAAALRVLQASKAAGPRCSRWSPGWTASTATAAWPWPSRRGCGRGGSNPW